MTRYEWPDIIPDFDVLKWKAETQAHIYQETKDMSSKEVIEYFRKSSERMQKERADYRARHGLD